MSAQRSDALEQRAEDVDAEGATEPDAEAVDQQPPEALSLDVVFEILKNERRRLVLQYLETDEQCALGTLAEHIAALENDTTVEALTAQQRKRVYVGLYQCHLPKMDDAGVVEFDQNRGTVRLREESDQLQEYLDAGEHEPTRWPRYYLAVAAAGVAVYALGVALGVAALVHVAAVGLAVAVAVTGLAHRTSTDDA